MQVVPTALVTREGPFVLSDWGRRSRLALFNSDASVRWGQSVVRFGVVRLVTPCNVVVG